MAVVKGDDMPELEAHRALVQKLHKCLQEEGPSISAAIDAAAELLGLVIINAHRTQSDATGCLEHILDDVDEYIRANWALSRAQIALAESTKAKH